MPRLAFAMQLHAKRDKGISDELAYAGYRKGDTRAVRSLAHLELPLGNFRLRYKSGIQGHFPSEMAAQNVVIWRQRVPSVGHADRFLGCCENHCRSFC